MTLGRASLEVRNSRSKELAVTLDRDLGARSLVGNLEVLEEAAQLLDWMAHPVGLLLP